MQSQPNFTPLPYSVEDPLRCWPGVVLSDHAPATRLTTGTVKLFPNSGLFSVRHRPTPSERTNTGSPTSSSGCGLPTAC